MLKAFLFLAVIQFASCLNDCAKGPEHWCQSVQTANECNAFKHCTQTVWTKHQKFIKNSLEITNGVEKECSACVQCLYSDVRRCPNVRVFKNEINELFSYNLPAESICKLIDQCEIIKTPKEKIQAVNVYDDKTCGFCMFVISRVQQVIQQNATEIDIRNVLVSACNMLPKNQTQQCIQDVDQYLPEVLNIIRDNTDAGVICRVLKLCSDQNIKKVKEDIKPVKKTGKFSWDQIRIKLMNEKEAIIKTPLQNNQYFSSKLSKSNGMGCELCNIILSAAKYLIKNDVDDEKIIDFMEKNLCDRLGSLAQTCDDYLKIEGKNIIDLLKNETEPSLICEKAGLCLKTQINTNLKYDGVFDLNVRTSSNCNKCQNSVDNIKEMIEKDIREFHIINYINNNLCENSGSSKELCKSLVNIHGDLMIIIMNQEIKSKQVCSMFGMCNEIEIEETPDVYYNIENSLEVSNENCILCQFVMKLLTNYIAKNSTEAEIKEGLDFVCKSVIPGQYKDQCLGLVETYTDTIIYLIAKQIPTEYICQVLGVCKNQDKETKSNQLIGAEEKYINHKPLIDLKPSKRVDIRSDHVEISEKKIDDSIECTLCVYVAQLADNFLKKNKTEAEIEKELKLVCNFFPAKLSAECTSFINEYGPYIIELIAADLEPEMVCAYLNLCNNNLMQIKPKKLTANMIKNKLRPFN